MAVNPEWLIKVRGGPDTQSGEATLFQELDAWLGTTPGNVLYRSQTGWSSVVPTTIPLAYGLIFNVSGTLSVATDVSPHVLIPGTFSTFYLSGTCKTNPVGADVTIKFRFSSDFGQTFTQDTTFFTACLNGTGGAAGPQNNGAFGNGVWTPGSIVGLDVTQVGSGTAGANLQVVLLGLMSLTGY